MKVSEHFKLIGISILIIVGLASTTAVEAGDNPNTDKFFRDCPNCPEMVVIPAGSFEMGSPSYLSPEWGDEGPIRRHDSEGPVHHVTIGKSFALGKTEVTQGQWRAIMGTNPSSFPDCGDNCPVDGVNWNDAQKFIEKLNAKTGKQYRLPSEAEWEYACRAGEQQKYCGSDDIDSVAWNGSNGGPNFVALKHPNAWGLYDMSGNLWEWVEDVWHKNYDGAPTDGSARSWSGKGDKRLILRVLRGGSWSSTPEEFVRATIRDGSAPTEGSVDYGFRLARRLP